MALHQLKRNQALTIRSRLSSVLSPSPKNVPWFGCGVTQEFVTLFTLVTTVPPPAHNTLPTQYFMDFIMCASCGLQWVVENFPQVV